MNLKQFFCKHEYEKTDTERYGGFLHKGGKIIGGRLFYRCKCISCSKLIFVYVREDSK